jgi:hypothetical protein
MTTPLKDLENYAKYIVKDGGFDTIVDIKKAITNGDQPAALMHLGQLKEQLWVVRHYVASLESGSAANETSRQKVDIQVERPLLGESSTVPS